MTPRLYTARRPPPPPPNAFWVNDRRLYRWFYAMGDTARTGIHYTMHVKAQEWCFDHIGPWIIREYAGDHIVQFKEDKDALVFLMRFADVSE